MLARSALKLRRYRRGSQDPVVRDLRNQGYTVIPSYLKHFEHQAVKAEFSRAISNPRFITKQVLDTAGILRTSAVIAEHDESHFPVTVARFKRSKKLCQWIADYDGRNHVDTDDSTFELAYWRLERASSVPPRALMSDHTNCELHSDTFYSIVKAFFYLHEVTAANGAHRVVPRSHQTTCSRLAAEYWNSVTARLGSPRPPRWVLRTSEPEQLLELPENHLILEDTFAFHAASPLMPGAVRDIIYLQYRGRPFAISP